MKLYEHFGTGHYRDTGANLVKCLIEKYDNLGKEARYPGVSTVLSRLYGFTMSKTLGKRLASSHF